MKKIKKSWVPRFNPFGAGAAISLIAMVVLAGCGGSSSTSSSSSGSSEAGSGSTSGTAESGAAPGGFQISSKQETCLKEAGVELPSGGQGGPPEGGAPPQGFEGGQPPEGGQPGGEMQEAIEKCGIEIPQGGPGGANAPNSAEYKSTIRAYVACVRENGYELPEPNLSGNGPVFKPSEVNQSNPKFAAASKKCQSQLRPPSGAAAEGSKSAQES
jgi:hypothetical protein